MSNTELRNVSALYNPMDLANFTELIPQVRSLSMLFDWLEIILFQIDWVEYFNTIFHMALDSENHHVFTEDDIVIVETVDYFYDLSLLLESTPEEYAVM